MYLVCRELHYNLSLLLLLFFHSLQLQIWDTGGAERYRTITKNYYNYANAVLLVYDLTEIHSLQNLSMWLQEARAFAPNAVPVMIGNKADLPPDMDLDIPDSFATSNDIKLHFKVSVKENEGLQGTLEAIATFLCSTLEEGEDELLQDDPNWDIVTLDVGESQKPCIGTRTPCFGLYTKLWRKQKQSPQHRDIDTPAQGLL